MAKKKKYMVMARDKKTALLGVTTKRGGHRDFGNKTTAMWISDKAEADEIEHTYGMKGRGDVFVVEDEKYSHAVNAEQWEMKHDEKGGHLKTIHHYTFTVPDLTGIRTRKDNGYVWVDMGTRQVRMKREQALAEGLTIVPDKKPREARKGRSRAEVSNGIRP